MFNRMKVRIRWPSVGHVDSMAAMIIVLAVVPCVGDNIFLEFDDLRLVVRQVTHLADGDIAADLVCERTTPQ
jgi:hypothetical protein